MKLKPLYHNVLVRPMREGDRSEGGLIIPAIATKKSPIQYGEVVATGDGRISAEGKVVPLSVKPGDVIAFARGAGTELPIVTRDGEDPEILVLMEERFIAGTCEGLRVATSLLGVDGRILDMEPLSRVLTEARGGAAPDCVYKNIEELERFEKDWKTDCSDHVDEETTDEVH